MKPTLIINDLHLGVRRVAGTTPDSAARLRQWSMQQYVALLDKTPQAGRCIVNGDVTDKFDIDLGDALDLYEATLGFLRRREDASLVWALGNHDLSKNSAQLGSVAFIGALLQGLLPGRFALIGSPSDVGDGIHIIPHLVNQAELDLALSRVPEDTKYLLLHCNYDNDFAAQADHSLNLSRAQAKTLIDKGATIVLGHEHHARSFFDGRVVITGNQFPTSVADCRSATGRTPTKQAAVIDGQGLHLLDTWRPDDEVGFVEVDWRRLDGLPADIAGFIRVSGEAQPDEAADALKRISRLRQKSNALVITNAVRVAAREGDLGEAVESVEDIRRVDVVSMLLDALTPEQRRVVETLLKQHKEKA